MKVWVWVEQSEEWEMVAECPANHAGWVAKALESKYPALNIMYGTEVPSHPLRLIQ